MTEKITKEELLKQVKATQDQIEKIKKQREAKEAILRGETPTVEEPATNSADVVPEPETVSSTETSADEKEIAQELKNLPPEERAKIGWGFDVIGFKAEKIKSDAFASAFQWILKKQGGKGDVGKWCQNIIDANIRNGDNAAKKANDLSAFKEAKIGKVIAGKTIGLTVSAENQRRLANLSGISGNILKYGTMAYNAFGHTVGSTWRIAMAASTATAFMAEEGKKARLQNTDLIEQQRINDVEEAAEEAWKIWEKAGGKKNDTGTLDADGKTIYSEIKNPTKEDLNRGYLMQMPEDLRKRINTDFEKKLSGHKDLLENIKINTPTFLSNIMKKDIGIAVAWLEKSIKKIDNNKKLSPEEKELAKERLLRGQEASLKDWDQIITQYGTADVMAMNLKYLETAGKTATSALQVQSLAFGLRYLMDKIPEIDVSKMWSKVTDVLYHHKTLLGANLPPAEPGHTPNLDTTHGSSFSKHIGENQPKFGQVKFGEHVFEDKIKSLKGLGVENSPATTPSPLGQHPEVAHTNIGANPNVQTEVTATPPAGSAHEAVASATSTHAEQAQSAAKKVAGRIAETPATPQAPEVSNVVNLDQDVVKQGEGIENALQRQIVHNYTLAKKLGYEGKEDDLGALKKFAGGAAHRVAIDKGYVDKFTGEEVRVAKADEVAYKLTLSGNQNDPFQVEEFHKDGGVFVSQEIHGNEATFEGDKVEAYEMRHARTVLHLDKTPEVSATPTETPAQSAIYDQNRLTTPVEVQQSLESLGFTGDPTDENEVLEYLKSIGYNNPGDAIRGEELHKAITDTLDSASQTSAPKTETIAEMLPIFKENMYNLQTPILRIINETHLRNLKALFPENTKNFWESLEKIKFDEFNERFNPNGQVAQYLKTLQKVTGEKPKMGIFGLFNKETVGHYIARALQYAGTKPGMLDKLKLE